MTDEFGRKEARNWGMVCHLAALLMFTSIPFANILGPLIVWMIKRDEDPFIDYHGREAVNFQISMTLYAIVAAILVIVVIGLVLLPVILIADVVLLIIAALKASNGETYAYPFTIRFIKGRNV